MISLRLMEDTMEDYVAMREWFLEPELQEWVWCDEIVWKIGEMRSFEKMRNETV